MDTKWNGTGSDGGAEPEYFVAPRAPRDTEAPEDVPGVPAVRPRRRAKAAVGFLSFFLGITLTLGSLGAAAERLVMQWGALPDWSGDWQNTQAFRDEVSGCLREFLSLGATGTTGNAWYQTAEAWDVAVGSGWERHYTEIILSDTEREARPATEVLEEDASQETEPDHPYRAGDKNVLYFITKNSELLYTNTEEQTSRQFSDRGFEGYNFYLTYHRGTVSIVKDGMELDVYGDGTYTSGQSQWFVPGYENLQAGKGLDGIAVYMAVRQEPVRYWFQDADGGQYYYGRMYNVARRAEEARVFFLRQAAVLAAGVLCLGLWFLLRREKRLADAKIASWTVHIWAEGWVLLTLIPLAWLFADRGWQELYWACRELWWRDWEPMYPGQLIYGAASFLFSGLPGLLALGWLLWLAFNNRRYNPKEKRKSLLGLLFRTVRKLLRGLRMKDLERPVEKRLARTLILGTAALAVVLAGALVLFLLLLPMLWYDLGWLLITVPLAALAAVALAALIPSLRSLRLARDLGRLSRQIESIRSGDLTTPLDLPEDADLRKTAEALNDIQAGMKSALAEQTRSERMKVELVSNVSHDLKTPLTSILSYAELLRQEDLPPAAADYARIIDEKARRLGAMVQDVFEVSKAAADQLSVTMERLDLGKLLRQTLADLDGPIQKSGLTFKVDLPERAVLIDADGKRLYRVFQNLIDNALRYALPGSRVYLALKTAEGQAETARLSRVAGLAQVSIRNTSRDELPEGVDFTARFVRGDESRTDGGSGLGLSIASSFTEACGGTFRVETVADLFTAVAAFPLAEAEQEAAR